MGPWSNRRWSILIVAAEVSLCVLGLACGLGLRYANRHRVSEVLTPGEASAASQDGFRLSVESVRRVGDVLRVRCVLRYETDEAGRVPRGWYFIRQTFNLTVLFLDRDNRPACRPLDVPCYHHLSFQRRESPEQDHLLQVVPPTDAAYLCVRFGGGRPTSVPIDISPLLKEPSAWSSGMAPRVVGGAGLYEAPG